ncbi:MAG TPA: site-2 protease family protein [Polyangiales bacterium]|nr:site-2 protease family protein [Polyangiales bacterium]
MLDSTHHPTRSPDLLLEPPHDGRRVVFSSRTGRYYRLGVREAAFLESLDGARSLDALKASPPDGLSAEQVERIVSWLDTQGLLQAPEVAAEPLSRRRRIGRAIIDAVIRPGDLRVPLVRPDAWLDRHKGLVDALCSGPALLVYCVVLASPFGVAALFPQRLLEVAFSMDPRLSGGAWALLYASILLTIGMHELAHALVCKHFGARVHRMGVMLFYLNPVAYCDISDSWRLVQRKAKILIAAAGIFVQAVLASAALSGWMLSGKAILLHYTAVNAGLIAFNLIPFVKLDGYWMLVHLLNEPNLRWKALAAVDQRLRRWLGRSTATEQHTAAGYIAFGVAHILAVPIFLGLGVLALYRLGAWFSPLAGVCLACIATLALLYRAVRVAIGYTAALSRREARGGV